MNTQTVENLIIGAGLAGLTLAQELQKKSKSVLVLEKSRGVGGRMATRRDGDFTFDHGAQFYVASPRFALDAHWVETGVAQEWFKRKGRSYKAAAGGITRLAKNLLGATSLELNQRVDRIARATTHKWSVITDQGTQFTAQKVFFTCPLPQSIEILEKSKISFPSELKHITYAKALVGLFEVETEEPKFLQMNFESEVSKEIFSISNQLSKRVSQKLGFTVIMQPEWSESYFDEAESISLELIRNLFSAQLSSQVLPLAPVNLSIGKGTLKKWRYAHPLQVYPKLFECLDNDVFLLGDAFGGPSINGAYKSAMAVTSIL